MSTFAKVKLSASTDGRAIKVAATATAGTTIHTAHATSMDEVWLWAMNSTTTKQKLVIEFGGVTAPDDLVEQYLEPEDGAILIIPGWALTNSLLVRAFAETTNIITINGFVNRIT